MNVFAILRETGKDLRSTAMQSSDPAGQQRKISGAFAQYSSCRQLYFYSYARFDLIAVCFKGIASLTDTVLEVHETD